MRIIGLIRHGSTDLNMEGRLQGQQDTPLNDTGLKQAHALALWLAQQDWQWGSIYCSDMIRAKATAEIIADKLSLAHLNTDIRLRERALGRCEGMMRKDFMLLYKDKLKGTYDQKLGIETDTILQERAIQFWNDFRLRIPQGNHLIVSHGGLLKQLIQTITGAPLSNVDSLGNTSITLIEETQDEWGILMSNSIIHLDCVSPGL